MKTPETFESTQSRLWWVGGLYAILSLVLLGGLLFRQVIQYGYFKGLEQRQSLRRVLLPAPRGVIYDRNGAVLATNTPRFSLIVYMGELRPELRREQIRLVRLAREQGRVLSSDEIQRAAIASILRAHLAPIEKNLGRSVELNLDKLEGHLYQKPLMPYTLLDNLSLEQFARLAEMLRVDAPIQLQVSSQRLYPQGPLAAHGIGFVASRDPTDVTESNLRTFSFKGQEGLNGIEKSQEKTLAGRTGYELWVVDPSGYRYEPREKVSASAGNPVVLTLDMRLQKPLEKALGNRVGAAVALDVHTGEVLAMASHPTYNPNDLIPSFSRAVDEKIRIHNGWINRAIQGLYPPGSTFKLFTAIAALNSGQLGIDETLNCPAFLEVGGRKFPEHRATGYGDINLVRALEVSSNVFFYQVGLRVGPDAIMAQGRKFGLDKPTGIELPGETHRMVLPTPEWKKTHLYEPWYAGDTANCAIGQGYVLVTPLQMACAVASLARGDFLTTPTILKPTTAVHFPNKPYSAGWASIVEGMKAAATTGTGRLCRVDGLPIAAKTGTAQVMSHGAPLHLAWFVGFAPVENPQVAIAVVLEETSVDEEYAGGVTAAPVARSFFEAWAATRTSSALAPAVTNP